MKNPERYTAVAQITAALLSNPLFALKGGPKNDRFGGAVEQAQVIEQHVYEMHSAKYPEVHGLD